MSVTSEQQRLVNIIEDVYIVLEKTQTNLQECPKQRLTRGYIETKIQNIEEYWQTLRNAHQDLVKCTTKLRRNELPYFLNEDYFVVENLYTCIVGDLKDMLITAVPSNINSQRQVHEPSVKLPKIELPTFTGCYYDWPTFRDLFTSLVHNNTRLSKVEKLHYLKSSLVGEPEELLKHVYVLESNYEQAWDILSQRYGNKRLIVNSLLHKLFSLKKITSPSTIQYKNILDITSQCLNHLSNQEIPTDSWDQIIIYLIVQRLDSDTHKDWEEYAFTEDANELPSWSQLKKFLEIRYRTLEMLSGGGPEKTLTETKTFHATALRSKDPTTLPKTCIMCRANHTLPHCKQFSKLQVQERTEYVKKWKLCYNCLLGGHTLLKCLNKLKCQRCQRRHHSLICRRGLDKIEENGARRNPEQENDTRPAVTMHLASERSTTLLPTAIVTVRHDNGQIFRLRTLIDQGSEINLISEQAAQLLRGERKPAERKVTWIGSAGTIVGQVIQLELQSRYKSTFKLPIDAYIIPRRITTDLPSKPVSSKIHTWQHLRGLTLADPSFNTPGKVDMLLGVEVYAHILESEFLKGPTGSPCAQNTNLGWILFGSIQAETSQELDMHRHFDNLLKNTEVIDKDAKRVKGIFEGNKRTHIENKGNLKQREISIKERLHLQRITNDSRETLSVKVEDVYPETKSKGSELKKKIITTYTKNNLPSGTSETKWKNNNKWVRKLNDITKIRIKGYLPES